MLETVRLVLYKSSAFLFFIFILQTLIFGQGYPDKRVDSLLKSGINSIIKQNYKSAGSTFTELNNLYPELPLGKIYLAAVKIAEAYDYGEAFDSGFIESRLDSAESQSENLIDSSDTNVWFRYFLALSEGYFSYYEALQEDWFSAFSDGYDALSDFKKCMKIQTDFPEALAPIGTYKYWRSRKTSFLNWLPFVGDYREEGIKYLERSIKESSYNTYIALHSLQWIYIDKKDYVDALRISELALKKYPDSRFFMWGLARAYEDIDKRKSINIYYKILNSYSPPADTGHYNEILLKHLIAQQYALLGDKKAALKLCGEIFSIDNLSDFVRDKLGDRLERVRKLQMELSR